MDISYIMFKPKSGEALYDCKWQAVKNCVIYDCEISFIHNERLYIVTPDRLKESVLEKGIINYKDRTDLSETQLDSEMVINRMKP